MLKINPVLYITLLFIVMACSTDKPSCKTGNCENGYGVKIYPDGGFDKGYWKNGKLDGYGEQLFGKDSKWETAAQWTNDI